jgi:hypothetical protein
MLMGAVEADMIAGLVLLSASPPDAVRASRRGWEILRVA